MPALVFFIVFLYATDTPCSLPIVASSRRLWKVSSWTCHIIEIVVPEFDVFRDLSMFLMMNLIERGYSFAANAEKEIVPVVKEKPCYVCLDFGTEHKSLSQIDKENVYVLPDGNIITVATNVSVARNCCS